MANEAWEFKLDGSEKIQVLDFSGNPADCKGQFTEFNPPEITKKFDTDDRLAEYGTIARSLGLEEMTSTMTLKGISAEFAKMAAEAFGSDKPLSIILTGKAKSRYDSATSDMMTTVRGQLKKLPVPMYKAKEIAELQMEMTLTYYAQNLSTFSLVIDLELRQFLVNGKNLW